MNNNFPIDYRDRVSKLGSILPSSIEGKPREITLFPTPTPTETPTPTQTIISTPTETIFVTA